MAASDCIRRSSTRHRSARTLGMKARRKRISIVIGVLLALYCLGYIGARLNHKVVHYIAADASGNHGWHDVTGGDVRDASLTGEFLNARIAAFYTPLRYVELQLWYLACPIGSPLTSSQKQAFGILPTTNYPPVNTNVIAWDQAVKMIKSGQVRTVIQTHSLYVGLSTTNGVWYHTTEPRIDEVFLLIRQHAPNKIGEITE